MRRVLTILTAGVLGACAAIRPTPRAAHLEAPRGWREVSAVPGAGPSEQWWKTWGTRNWMP